MVILSNFAENLSVLMQEKNLNAPALGKLLSMDRSNITRYLRGERLPDYRVFVTLVEYFNVSADVLLGRLDYCAVQMFQHTPPFGNTLRKVLDETKVSQAELQKQLHFSSATIYMWLNNKRLPTMTHVVQLANYLETTVDYLLGRIS